MMDLLEFLEKAIWILVAICGGLTLLLAIVAPSKRQEVFYAYCILVLKAFTSMVVMRLLEMSALEEVTSPQDDFDWYVTGLICMAVIVTLQSLSKAASARDKQN